MENTRNKYAKYLFDAAAVIAAAVFFLPSVFYDRQTKKDGSLTYTILRLF